MLAEAFMKGKGLAVTNGLYLPLWNAKLGAATWYIQHSDNQQGYGTAFRQ
jgi:hypothetical protein